MALIGDVVLPGDKIHIDIENPDDKSSVVIGPGLCHNLDTVIATKPGVLRFREPTVYWVDGHQKRYIPARGDNVIGVVTSKGLDIFRIDIGTSEPASLSYLAFEGATKRNRPDVKVGDLVYACLLVANKDMQPELVCIDSNGRGSGYGVLRGGFMIHTSTSLARKILSTQSGVLQRLGKSLPFEIAVGMNGRIWVNGRSTNETLALAHAVSGAELLNKAQVKEMVQKLSDSLSGI